MNTEKTAPIPTVKTEAANPATGNHEGQPAGKPSGEQGKGVEAPAKPAGSDKR